MLNFRKIPGIGRWLIIGLCACLISLSPSLARADSPFYWDFIKVDINLQTNGDLLVTETQKYTFTDDHTNQRYRYIPLDRVDRITDVEVYEGEERLATETGTENGQYWIRWQHRLNPPESHTFVLKYRVVGGVQVQGETSQVHWRALFPGRSVPIKEGKVIVYVPDALSGNVDSFVSMGAAASDRQINPNTFEFTVNEPLLPQQFLDVKLRFPRAILNIAPPQWQSNPRSDNRPPETRTNTSPRQRTSQYSLLLDILLSAGLVILPVAVMFLVSTVRKRCPNCGKYKLRRVSRVRRQATRKRQGSREIEHSCDSCNYHRTFTQKIPKVSTASTAGRSSGYGGTFGAGGGFGGGGGGAGGAGGGGGGG